MQVEKNLSLQSSPDDSILQELQVLAGAEEKSETTLITKSLTFLFLPGTLMDMQKSTHAEKFLQLLPRCLLPLIASNQLTLNTLRTYFATINNKNQAPFIAAFSPKDLAIWYRQQGDLYALFPDEFATALAEESYLNSLILDNNEQTQTACIALSLMQSIEALCQCWLPMPARGAEMMVANHPAAVKTRLQQPDSKPVQLVYEKTDPSATGQWVLATYLTPQTFLWQPLNDCPEFLWRSDPELKTQAAESWIAKSETLKQAILAEVDAWGFELQVQHRVDSLWRLAEPLLTLLRDLTPLANRWIDRCYQRYFTPFLHQAMTSFDTALSRLSEDKTILSKKVDTYVAWMAQCSAHGQLTLAQAGYQRLLQVGVIHLISPTLREQIRQAAQKTVLPEVKPKSLNPWQVSSQAYPPLFAALDPSCSTSWSSAQDSFTQTIQKQLMAEIKTCVELLGPPPIAFNILGMGSLSLGQLVPQSDLDIAILLPEEQQHYRQHHYWPKLLRLLQNRLLALHGAYLTLDPGDLEAMGCRSLTEEKAESDAAITLLNTPKNWIRLFFNPETPNRYEEFRHSLLRPLLLYAYQDNPEPYRQYCQQLLQILGLSSSPVTEQPSSLTLSPTNLTGQSSQNLAGHSSQHFNLTGHPPYHQTLALQDWQRHFQAFHKIVERLFDPEQPTLCLKVDLLRPLLNWVLSAGLYAGLLAPEAQVTGVSTLTRSYPSLLSQLSTGEHPLLTPASATRIQATLDRLQQLRVRLHRENRATQVAQTGLSKDQRNTLLKPDAKVTVQDKALFAMVRLEPADWAWIQTTVVEVILPLYQGTVLSPLPKPFDLSALLKNPESYRQTFRQLIQNTWVVDKPKLYESQRQQLQTAYERLQQRLTFTSLTPTEQEKICLAVGDCPLPDGTRFYWQAKQRAWQAELTTMVVAIADETRVLVAYQKQGLPIVRVVGLVEGDPKPRLLAVEFVQQLLTPQGQWRKKTDVRGRRVILQTHGTPLEQKTETQRTAIEQKTEAPSITSPSLFWKILPELPGIEAAIGDLAQRLVGFATPFVELVQLHIQHPQYPKPLPVLLSAAIPQTAEAFGSEMEKALTKEPNLLKRLPLVPKHYTQFFFLHLLTHPEDGTPDNFVFISSYLGDGYQMISIDNDHHFVLGFKSVRDESFAALHDPADDKESDIPTPKPQDQNASQLLQVKTLVFCLNQMADDLDQGAVQEFLQLDVDTLVTRWLTTMAEWDKRHMMIFASDRQHWLAEKKERFSYDRPVLGQRTLERLYEQAHGLQRLLRTQPKLTHLEVLEAIHPLIGRRYRQLLSRFPQHSPLGRMKSLIDEWRSQRHTAHLPSSTQGQQVLSAMGDDEDNLLEQIRKNTAAHPDTLSRQWHAICTAEQRFQPLKHRLAPYAKWPVPWEQKPMTPQELYFEFKNNAAAGEARMSLVNALHWPNFINAYASNPPEQKALSGLLQEITSSSYEKVVFSNISLLKTSDLNRLIKKNDRLKSLFLKDCGGVTETWLAQLPQQCVQLTQVILSDLPIKFLAADTVVAWEPLDWPSIIHLEIKRCPKLKRVTLKVNHLERLVLKNHPQLQELHLDVDHTKKLLQLDLWDLPLLEKVTFTGKAFPDWPPVAWNPGEVKTAAERQERVMIELALWYALQSEHPPMAMQARYWAKQGRLQHTLTHTPIVEYVVNQTLTVSQQGQILLWRYLAHQQVIPPPSLILLLIEDEDNHITLPTLSTSSPHSSSPTFALSSQLFLAASEYGLLNWMRQLLVIEGSLLWQVRDERDDTALHLALMQNQEAIIQYCWDSKAPGAWPVTAKGFGGRTPFLAAARHGRLTWFKQMAESTRFAGHEVWADRDKNGDAALPIALWQNQETIIQYCWESKAPDAWPITAKGFAARTPFLEAAFYGRLTWFKQMAESTRFAGQDVWADRDQNGDTALHIALWQNHEAIIQYCWDNKAPGAWPITAKGYQGRSLFLEAACLGRLAWFKKMAESTRFRGHDVWADRDQDGDTALHLALLSKNEATITWALNHCPSALILEKTVWGYTTLHVAAKENISLGIDLLIQRHHVPIDITDSRGTTPAMLAARNGHLEPLKRVLEHKADLSKTDHYGDNVYAMAHYNQQTEVIAWLQTQGVSQVSREPAVVMAKRLEHFSLVHLLLTGVNTQDSNGDYPIHLAARIGNISLIQALLLEGTSFTQQDKLGRTPALVMAAYNQAILLEWLGFRFIKYKEATDHQGHNLAHWIAKNNSLACLKILFLADSHLWFAKNQQGDTPLMLAAKAGHMAIVAWFLEQFPYYNLNVINQNGENALWLALIGQHSAIVNQLYHAGARLIFGDDKPYATINRLRLTDTIIPDADIAATIRVLSSSSNIQTLQFQSSLAGPLTLAAIDTLLKTNTSITRITATAEWKATRAETLQTWQVKLQENRRQFAPYLWFGTIAILRGIATETSLLKAQHCLQIIYAFLDWPQVNYTPHTQAFLHHRISSPLTKPGSGLFDFPIMPATSLSTSTPSESTVSLR